MRRPSKTWRGSCRASAVSWWSRSRHSPAREDRLGAPGQLGLQPGGFPFEPFPLGGPVVAVRPEFLVPEQRGLDNDRGEQLVLEAIGHVRVEPVDRLAER